jgi:glycosyltransferase involved in cell wall biosynthesis
VTEAMANSRPLRIFVASAAEVLTDHVPHGEGLIAWQTFSALADKGHELVVCARRVDLKTGPRFDIVETGMALRWESLEPLAYALRVRRIFAQRGGAKAFDAVHWLFPQEPLCFVPPRRVNFVIGPRLSSWPAAPGRGRALRPGDAVRTIAQPALAALRYSSLSRASRILVSTPSAVDELPARHRARAHVIPFGVDEARFRPAPLPDVPTVLYAGRLDPVKQVRQLVEAFGIASGILPDARLILAGEGADRAWIESRCVELGIQDAVTLLGRVSHAEIPDLLQRCSVLCLPSRGEPFGMVVLEAMASARAVVAVADGGPGWLVDSGQGGSLVPHGAAAELAEALIDVLREPPRLQAMGRHNRTRVEGEFSLSRLVESLERAYGSDASPRQSGRSGDLAEVAR